MQSPVSEKRLTNKRNNMYWSSLILLLVIIGAGLIGSGMALCNGVSTPHGGMTLFFLVSLLLLADSKFIASFSSAATLVCMTIFIGLLGYASGSMLDQIVRTGPGWTESIFLLFLGIVLLVAEMGLYAFSFQKMKSSSLIIISFIGAFIPAVLVIVVGRAMDMGFAQVMACLLVAFIFKWHVGRMLRHHEEGRSTVNNSAVLAVNISKSPFAPVLVPARAAINTTVKLIDIINPFDRF